MVQIMPREVRVLAVEDRPWWMQPLFSFPFIGDLSARQLIIVAVFVLPATLSAVALRLGFLRMLSLLFIMIFVGLGVAKKPVRSVLPEKQLLILIAGKYRPRVRSYAKELVEKPVEKASLSVPETVDIVARDPSRIPSIKIAGVLRDSLGNPLSGAEIEVLVNGRIYTRVRTGSSGEYTVYYAPDGPGLYEIEIRLHGSPILRRRVRVGVRG